MTTSTRERRDWTLLIFIIPIGIIFMLIAGQIAIRLVPVWSIDAGMQSNLDPSNLPKQQNGIVPPILPAILTPLGWFDTFLTPGAGFGDQNIVFPPFVVFEPSATSVATASPPPTVATQLPTTIPATTPPTVVVIPPVTITQKPPPDEGTPIPPTVVTLPPTVVTLPPTVVTPVPTATGTPSLPSGVADAVPVEIGVNAAPDGTIGGITPGTYVVINISANPIWVSGIADGNYDLVFYESLYPNIGGTEIQLDQIIIGISNATDGSYYEVFNWGDNAADTNTNLNPAIQPELDNTTISSSTLYTPNSADPTIPQTGILIDVDTAQGAPPEGFYNNLVIISPVGVDPAQVDSVVVTEVPIPP